MVCQCLPSGRLRTCFWAWEASQYLENRIILNIKLFQCMPQWCQLPISRFSTNNYTYPTCTGVWHCCHLFPTFMYLSMCIPPFRARWRIVKALGICWLPWVDDAWWPTWHSRGSRRWKKRWKDGRITCSIELEGMKHHETSMFFSTCQWTQHGAKKWAQESQESSHGRQESPGCGHLWWYRLVPKVFPYGTWYNEDLANCDGHVMNRVFLIECLQGFCWMLLIDLGELWGCVLTALSCRGTSPRAFGACHGEGSHDRVTLKDGSCEWRIQVKSEDPTWSGNVRGVYDFYIFHILVYIFWPFLFSRGYVWLKDYDDYTKSAIQFQDLPVWSKEQNSWG